MKRLRNKSIVILDGVARKTWGNSCVNNSQKFLYCAYLMENVVKYL